MGTGPKAGAKKKAAKGSVFLPSALRAWDIEGFRFGDVFYTQEAEDALALEAFRRGADVTAVFKIVTLRRDALRRSRMSHELRGLGTEIAPLSGRLEFDQPFDPLPVWDDYRRAMRAEWERIPGWVQDSFDFDAAGKKAFAGVSGDERRFTFYLGSRPLYYQNGYSKPADQIFLKLTETKFLNLRVIGGVSQSFADALREAEKLLTLWGRPINALGGADVKKIGGFVPRFIAGTTALSNHAFGLAIDVDYPTNPHLKKGEKGPSAAVFDVLRKITGYDFGASFINASLPPIDRAKYIHSQQQQASAKLQVWLQTHLPEYISMARAQSAGRKPSDPLWKEDEFTSSLPTQTTLEAIDIQTLVSGYSLDGIKDWARGGIQTVPVDLAAALMETGMRWGSEYDHSKDVMHFEQNPASKYLPGDSKMRPLTDLLLPGQAPRFHLITDEEWVRGHW